MAWVFRRLPSRNGYSVIALRDSNAVASEDIVKTWMRTSVVISELLLWVPAIVLGWVGVVLDGKGQGVKRSQRTKVSNA